MRTTTITFVLGALALGACAAPPSSLSPTVSSLEEQTAVPARPRPPLVTRSCARLTPDELWEASEYLSRVTRFRTLYPEDASDAMQQRDISGNPGRVVGVVLFLPAERGMNRAYLERLLYCHAVQPPHLGEHPNDPLLTPGILSVEISEALGGEYEIRIIGEDRTPAEQILERARAVKNSRSSGSVEVKQLDPPL